MGFSVSTLAAIFLWNTSIVTHALDMGPGVVVSVGNFDFSSVVLTS
jgi:hypothetical protein